MILRSFHFNFAQCAQFKKNGKFLIQNYCFFIEYLIFKRIHKKNLKNVARWRAWIKTSFFLQNQSETFIKIDFKVLYKPHWFWEIIKTFIKFTKHEIKRWSRRIFRIKQKFKWTTITQIDEHQTAHFFKFGRKSVQKLKFQKKISFFLIWQKHC